MESSAKDLEKYIKSRKSNKVIKAISGALATATILGALASCDQNTPVRPIDSSSEAVTVEPVDPITSIEITTSPESEPVTSDISSRGEDTSLEVSETETTEPITEEPKYPDISTPSEIIKGFDPETPIEDCKGEEKVVKLVYEYLGKYERYKGVILSRSLDYNSNKSVTTVDFVDYKGRIVENQSITTNSDLYEICRDLLNANDNKTLYVDFSKNSEIADKVCEAIYKSAKDLHGDKTFEQESKEQSELKVDQMSYSQKLDKINEIYCIKNDLRNGWLDRNMPYNITNLLLYKVQDKQTKEPQTLIRLFSNYARNIEYPRGSDISNATENIFTLMVDFKADEHLIEEIAKTVGSSDNTYIPFKRTEGTADQYEQVAKLIYDYVSTHYPEYSPESEMER